MNAIPESDLESRKSRLQEQELEYKRAQLAIDFAKFGFAGTLAAGFGGLILILALAIIDAASTDFTFGVYGVLGTSALLVAGTLGFGAFSLWQPIKILAKFGKMSLGVESESDKEKSRAAHKR
jgi:hypothetical protein